MAINDIVQTIAEARVDARSLSEFVFKPAGFIVSRRLAPSVRTLQYYVDRFETIDSSFTQALNTANAAAVTATNNAVGLVDTVTNESRQSVQNAIREVAIDANLVTDALTTVVPLHSGETSMTQLDKNRENVSIMDFFTKAELAGYRNSPTTFDATRPIQAFFDYIALNNLGNAHATGVFYVSEGIMVGAPLTLTGNRQCLTKLVYGNLTLNALNPIHTLITFETGQEFTWLGKLSVSGAPSNKFNGRTLDVGIRIGSNGGGLASRCYFHFLSAKYCRSWGVYLGNLGTLTHIEYIRVSYCGSGLLSGTYPYSLEYSYTKKEDIGRSSAVDQRSVFTLQDDFPDYIVGPAFIRKGTNWSSVVEYDETSKELSCFPWISDDDTNSLVPVFGGGVYVNGSDTSVTSFGTLDIVSSSIGLFDTALYGANIRTLTVQLCAVGAIFGGSRSSGHIGGSIAATYLENVAAHYVLLSLSPDMNKSIGTTYGVNTNKFVYLGEAKETPNSVSSYGDTGLVSWNYNGRMVSHSILKGSITHVAIGENYNQVVRVSPSEKLNIRVSPASIGDQKALGYIHKNLLVTVNNSTNFKGSIDITPIAGFTVNGKEKEMLTGFSDSNIEILFYCNNSSDITTTIIKGKSKNSVLEVTGTISPFTVPANSNWSVEIPAEGFLVGEPVSMGMDFYAEGLVKTYEVVINNKIVVTYLNLTDSDITSTGGTYKVHKNLIS